jgi:hypothetical protein
MTNREKSDISKQDLYKSMRWEALCVDKPRAHFPVESSRRNSAMRTTPGQRSADDKPRPD